MLRVPSTLLTLVIAAWLGTNAGWASEAAVGQPGSSARTAQRVARQALPTQAGVSLTEAIAMARGRFPGRVVKAETRQRGARSEHVVRIINNQGRVRTFRIDARTGQFL